ncbi:Structural maintenance of chromosomes protein 5 [Physocladia obscura]|uniref:Structural maintenance of chromosomes protein 5 n=1 Tax=Physocladia obscura TaxID=109957 RepID=A0AAD5XI69_9FUNG|nr:Structural maintenance of chromosomes protein 5 [Physocladia obscura]
MAPKELLVETERAAGERSLLESHMALITMGKQLKELEKSFTTDADHLESLKKKQASLQEQVDRLKEREKHLQDAKFLTLALPFAKFDKIKEALEEARQRKEHVEILKRDCDEKLQPVSEIVENLKNASKLAREDSKTAQVTYGTELTKVEKIITEISKSEDREQSHARQVKDAKKAVIDAEAKVTNMAQQRTKIGVDIERLRNDLERNKLLNGNGAVADAARSPEVLAINDELAQLSQQSKDLYTEVEGLNFQKAPILEEIQLCQREVQKLHDELKGLANVNIQKMRALEHFSKPAFEGVRILRANNHGLALEKEILEPICMGITPVSPDYAAPLETVIGYNKLISFVAQTEHDYQLFRDYLYKQKIRINILCVQHIRNDFQPTVSLDEVRGLGFDGVLIEYVKGDPILMSALMQYTPVHEAPIHLRDNPNFNFKKVDVVGGKIRNYIVGPISYNVKSGYGSISAKSEAMRPAQILKLSVDTERESQLRRNIQEWETRGSNLRKDKDSLDAKQDILKARDSQLRAQRTELMAKKRDIMNRKAKFEKAQAEYETATIKLDSLKVELERCNAKVVQLAAQKHKYALDRADMNLQLVALQVRTGKAFDAVIKSGLRKVQIDAEYADAIQVENTAKEKNAEINTSYDKIKAEFDKARRVAREMKDELKESTEKMSIEDKREVYKMKEGKTVEDIEILLAQTIARADLLNSNDGNVMAIYEKRKIEIAEFEKKHARNEENVAQNKAAIEEIRADWEPKVQTLVDKISEKFSKSLQTKKEDNFAEWSVEILVKFRDNEKLQVLDNHRQSGGERSVTTITYLMALQKMSKAPFRVVDEINQGMDPRNERAIHKQMVHVACQEGGSQYFLITPKLLPDLEYHKRMKVLTIYNGDHQPEKFDIDGFIAKKKQRTV